MIDTKCFRRKANIIGWLMMLPACISLLLFIFYPIIFSIFISFTDFKFIFENVSFSGVDNYKWLFSESGKQFWKSLVVSLKFAFISTVIQTFLGFLFAYVLYNMASRTQGIYKVLIYIPVVLPAAVVSVMWTFIYAPNVGLIDRLLAMAGMNNPPLWLSNPSTALGAVIFTNTWRYIGTTVIIYFVSMNAIPKDVTESAKIDGAGAGRMLWSMILPLTFSYTKVNILLSLMGGIKSFDLFYLFTGGTPNDQLYVVGLYIYNTAFKFRTFCRAVTMSLVLSVIIGTVTILTNKLLSKTENSFE